MIASAIVHATLVAVAVVGGHGPSSSPAASPGVEITIETLEPQPAQPEQAPALNIEAPAAAAHAHVHAHTHDYPVPLDHDRPHDPSLVHDHAATSEASEASEVIAVSAPAAAPVFNIVVGSASVPHGGLTAAHPAHGVGTAGDPVPESSVNVAARLLTSAPPVYPPAARAAEVEADVVLDLVLDDEGRVSDAKVLRAAGYGLDGSALEAIRGYRFSPAQRDGRPVRVRMHWTVQFRLR